MPRVLLVAAVLVGAGALAGEAWAPAREADLAVAVSAGSSSTGLGQAVRLTTVVRNIGPDSALDVVVKQTLPEGATLVSARPSQGSCTGASTVTCRLGLMGWGNQAHGAKATVELVVRADALGALESVAEVSSASLALELVPENDSSTARVEVEPYTGARPHAELEVKLFAPRTARVRRRLTYTARITNLGPDALGPLSVGGEQLVTRTVVPRRRGVLRLVYRGATATVSVR